MRREKDVREGVTVAIVGGGFGGTYAIKELERLRSLSRRKLKVLLFEPRERFVFTPLLHEVATAGLELEQVTIEYHALFEKKPWITHIKERVDTLLLKKRRLMAGGISYTYDYLLLATGSETNFYGDKGLAKKALVLKDEADAQGIRLRLEQAILDAAQAKTPAAQAKPLSVAVIGGGATGVELAPEILQFLRHRIKRHYRMIDKDAPRVFLLQGGPELIPGARACLRHEARRRLERMGVEVLLNAKVRSISASGLLYERDGEQERLDAAIKIWVAGITPVIVNGFGKGHYAVKADLSLMEDGDAFAIGDAACFDESCDLHPVPALAQVAVQEAKVVARNIIARINGRETRPFRFESKGFLVSLGQHDAIGELKLPVGSLCIKGFFAWWLWRTIYLFKFLDARQRFRTAAFWTTRLFTRRSLAPKRVKKK